MDAAGSNKILDRSDEKKGFPFYSELVDVTGKDKFLFSGGNIQVEVQTGFGAQANARIVQRLTLNFPPATLQVPKMKPGDATTKGLTDITKRFYKKVDGGIFNCLIVEGDVTRSVEINAAATSPTKGDLRLLAATEQVPAPGSPRIRNTLTRMCGPCIFSGRAARLTPARLGSMAVMTPSARETEPIVPLHKTPPVCW